MGSMASIAAAAIAANPPAATRRVWFKRIGPPWLWGVAARPLMARVCTALLGGPCGDESLPKTPPNAEVRVDTGPIHPRCYDSGRRLPAKRKAACRCCFSQARASDAEDSENSMSHSAAETAPRVLALA